MAQPQTLRGIFSGKNVVLPAWMPMLYIGAAALLGLLLVGSAVFSNDTPASRQPTITTDPYIDGAPDTGGVRDVSGRSATVPDAVLAAARESVGDARLVLLQSDETRYVFRAVISSETGPTIKTLAVVSVDGAYVVEAAEPAAIS